MKKIIVCSLVSLVGGVIIGWIFYKHIIGMILGVGLMGAIVILEFNHNQEDKTMIANFKTFLHDIYTELLVGVSFRNALEYAGRQIPSEETVFKLRVEELVSRFKYENTGDPWLQFEKEMNLDVVNQFVDVMRVSQYSGGKITSVISHTIQVISDQIDLEMEISVMVAAKKLEFYMMMIVPLAIIAALSNGEGSYMTILYTTFIGRVIMSGVLLVMCISFAIGRVIVDIEG